MRAGKCAAAGSVTLVRMEVAQEQRNAPGTHTALACPVCAARLPADAAIEGPDRLLRTHGVFDVRVCATCGSGVTSPLVREEDLDDYYVGSYGSYGEPSGGAYAAASAALKRAQVAALLRRPPFAQALAAVPGRALDVGCARGDLAAGLRSRGWSVDGVEPSPAAAALAAGRGVRVLGPTLTRAPIEAGAYDLVVMRHSLEHLPDPLSGVRALAGALSPRGVIVISLPNFASWQRGRFASRWFHLDLPRHRVHFTPSSLRTLLASAGLRVATEFTSTSVLGLPASLQYAVAGRCVAPAGVGLRAAAALCCAVFPLTWLIDGGGGGGRDTLHAVAERAQRLSARAVR
jgi:SAM-dependent methyltransferase